MFLKDRNEIKTSRYCLYNLSGKGLQFPSDQDSRIGSFRWVKHRVILIQTRMKGRWEESGQSYGHPGPDSVIPEVLSVHRLPYTHTLSSHTLHMHAYTDYRDMVPVYT